MSSFKENAAAALRVVNTSPKPFRRHRPQTPQNALNAANAPVSPLYEAGVAGLAIGSPPRDGESSPELQWPESSEAHSYDLKPPPSLVSPDNVELLSARFFSTDHLDLILRDYQLAVGFTRFLKQYRPQHMETLTQYANSRRAIAAVEYANALVTNMRLKPGRQPCAAATLNDNFDTSAKQTVEALMEEALPAYLTHRLVQLVTETLVKEITGNNAPIMRELIPSIAEVYCVTDPSLADNPIVYASEEFYNTTQYGREYTIGRNCRFLQGPKTSDAAVRRLINALAEGQEICETMLNYKRDGTPFMNLLMIAPLYDNKGQVRYFLGCQIDVSPLIEGGRGLESFARLLAKDRSESRFGGGRPHRDPKQALSDLIQMWSDDEAEIVKDRTRNASAVSHKASSESTQTSNSRAASMKASRGERVILGMDDPAPDMPLWPHASLGPSGRLPGVYQNYLLVRPYPSLRITFTSPALRIPGLLQTKFLDRISGNSNVREGLLDAFSRGTGVTAKVTWLTSSPANGDAASGQGKARWIHCTPLLGSDERVGVWMIVMVENEQVTGLLNRPQPASGTGLSSPQTGNGGGGAQKMSSNKLYADYLKRQPGTTSTHRTSSTHRDEREAEEHFQDF